MIPRCFNTFIPSPLVADWSIWTLIGNIVGLAESFTFFFFFLVKRVCNNFAHPTAKLALVSLQALCFNNSILSSTLQMACMVDYISLII